MAIINRYRFVHQTKSFQCHFAPKLEIKELDTSVLRADKIQATPLNPKLMASISNKLEKGSLVAVVVIIETEVLILCEMVNYFHKVIIESRKVQRIHTISHL